MNAPRTLPVVLLFALALACPAGEKSASRALPPDSREIVNLPELEFPLHLLHRGYSTGEVRLLVKISPAARLVDALVTNYTHKAFADAALAALNRSTFHPLYVNGKPVVTVTELIVRFQSEGPIAVEHFPGEGSAAWPDTYAYEPCDPSRLDRPLQPLAVKAPEYPQALCAQGVTGSVVVEFFIDETGRVRMPMVYEAENDLLAGLSLLAVEQWRFSPPSSRNQPVLVRVRQKFDFQPEKLGQG
jgi:TonB family protein